MKKLFIILTLITSCITATQAQRYSFDDQMLQQEKAQEFYKNVKKFYTAFNKEKRKEQISFYENLINFYTHALIKLQEEAEQGRKPSESTYYNTDSLLIKINQYLDSAEQILSKTETAIFDKAVKEQFPQWLGYDKYNWNLKNDDNTKNGLEILSKIDTIDLSHYGLMHIPEEITKCPNLKHINLLGNNYIDLKNVFQTLKRTQVNSVYFSVIATTDIDSEYLHLVTKIGLQLDNVCRLGYLLDYVYLYLFLPDNEKISNLTELDLSGKNLVDLSPEISKFNKLTKLNLSYNQLSTLPPEIANLTHLRVLNLKGHYSNFDITCLPDIFKNYQKEIVFSDNYTEDTSKLYISIGPSFNIGNTHIWGSLDNNSLYMEALKPTSISAEIRKLTFLKGLYIYNDFISIPTEIGNLTNLSSLTINETNLTNLPPGIWELKNLSILDLSRNKLSTLPPEIGRLKNLTKLDLSWNKLSRLPPEIGELTNLTVLSLDMNNLRTLPPEIGRLKNLTKLDLSGNNFSKKEKRKIKKWLPNCEIRW